MTSFRAVPINAAKRPYLTRYEKLIADMKIYPLSRFSGDTEDE